MRLLIDPEIFFYGRCGMVRYYSTLFKKLGELGIDIDLPLLVSNSDFIKGKYQSLEQLSKIIFKNLIKGKINSLSKKLYYRKLKEDEYDVLFLTSPVFEDNFLKYMNPSKKFIMVVHDTMRCVLGPDGLFDPAGSNADRLSYLARRASKVICISQNTKEDLMKLSGLREDRLAVVYTGALLNIEEEMIPETFVPETFLLFVGDRTGRKNFRFLIFSIAELLIKREELYLVCTGKSNVWEEDLLKSLGIENKVLFVEAPDPVLVHLYKNARALVYPSLYEGYGLPVLEAMGVGCPVITSDCSAIKEVGGDAVLYVDPNDKASIVRGVKTILEEQDIVNAKKEKGLKRAEIFTIEKMTENFYEEILKACKNN
jgi:glycosyltransferase involved in cell wall biosynthesis